MSSDENELLRAERRGRALAIALKPQKGHTWRIRTTADSDGAALLAAARWARHFGAEVEIIAPMEVEAPPFWATLAEYPTRGGFLRRRDGGPGDCPLLVVADGLEMRIKNIPSDAEAWSRSLSGSWPTIGKVSEKSLRMSTAECRAVDCRAITIFGVSGLCLMENAALAALAVAMDILAENRGKKVLIAVGGGNNGGDGLAVARGLSALGVSCEVALLKPSDCLSGDAGVNLRLLRECAVPIHAVHEKPQMLSDLARGSDLLVDALLGTGFKGSLSKPFRVAIASINKSGNPVLALDLPSGLDGDSGAVTDLAIQASRTVTFAAVKTGLERGAGKNYSGNLYLGDIGAPTEALVAGGDGNSWRMVNSLYLQK